MDLSSVVFSSTFRISSILMTGLVALTSSNRPRSQKDNIRRVTRHSNLWSHGFSRCLNSFSVGLCRGQCQHATLAWSSEKAYEDFCVTWCHLWKCEIRPPPKHLRRNVDKIMQFLLSNMQGDKDHARKMRPTASQPGICIPTGTPPIMPIGLTSKKIAPYPHEGKKNQNGFKKKDWLLGFIHLSMESQEKCTATYSCSN